MVIQKISELAEKLYLMMEVREFREQFPDIQLSSAGKKNGPPENGMAGDDRVCGNHRIVAENGVGVHIFYSFESGKLTFYEINAQIDYSESSYKILSGLFNTLCPVLMEKYSRGTIIHPLKDFREFSFMKLPSDGYPCDRYVIGAMCQWENGGKSVTLSFALMHPGYLFFQLRAVLLA